MKLGGAGSFCWVELQSPTGTTAKTQPQRNHELALILATEALEKQLK